MSSEGGETTTQPKRIWQRVVFRSGAGLVSVVHSIIHRFKSAQMCSEATGNVSTKHQAKGLGAR